MSFKIDKLTQEINITKGDSHSITFQKKGEPYEFKEDDVITMTVVKEINSDEHLFQIIATPDDNKHISIDIKPFHTKDADYGTYYYDIQLSESEGYVNTIIPSDPEYVPRFNICKEITR